MVGYHINTATRSLGRCDAEKGKCPFSSDPHYSDPESARVGYENFAEKIVKKEGLLQSVRKRVTKVFSKKYHLKTPRLQSDNKMVGGNWQESLISQTPVFMTRLKDELDAARKGGFLSAQFTPFSTPFHVAKDDSRQPNQTVVTFSLSQGVKETIGDKIDDVPFYTVNSTDPMAQRVEKATQKDPELADHVRKLSSIVDSFYGGETDKATTQITLPTDIELSRTNILASMSRMDELCAAMHQPNPPQEIQDEFKKEASKFAYHFCREKYFQGLENTERNLEKTPLAATPQTQENARKNYTRQYNTPQALKERRLALTEHLVANYPDIYSNDLSKIPEVI